MALIFNEEETKKIQEEQLLNSQNEAKQPRAVDNTLSKESTSAQDFFVSAKKAKADWNASYFDKPVQDNLDSIIGSDTYNNLVRADNMLTFIQKEMGNDYSVGGRSVTEVKSLLRSHGDTLNPMAVNRLNNIITSAYNKARDHRNIFEEAGAYLSTGISNMTDAHTANVLYAQYANASTEEEREAARAKLISFSKDTQDRSVLNPRSFDSYDNVSGFADNIGYMLQEAFTLAPQVITTTVLNAIPYVGTAASVGVLGSQMTGESILRQVSDGLDPNFWVALGEGAADTALERLTFGGGGKVAKMFNRAIPSANAKRAGNNALRHNFTVSGIKDFGKGIAGEVATEEAQYLTDLGARKIQTGKWLADGQTWSDVGAEMKEIGIATAFGVMPMQAVGSVSNERRYARELKKANMRLADQPIMQNVASYSAAGGFSSLSDDDRIRVNNALTYQNTLAAAENALDNFDLYAKRLGATTVEAKENLRQKLEQDRDGAKASLELVLNESNQAVKDIFTAYTSNYDYDNINGVVPDNFRASNNFSWEGILDNFKPVNNVEGNQNIGIATDPQTGIRIILHKATSKTTDGSYTPDFSVIEEGDVVDILPPEGGVVPANYQTTFDYNDYMLDYGGFDVSSMLEDITESAQQLNRYNEHRHQSLSKKAEEIADLVKGYNHNAEVRVVTSVNDLIDDIDRDDDIGNETNDAKFVLARMLANNPTATGFTVTQNTINKLIEQGMPGDLLGSEGTIYVVADRVKTNLDLISVVRHEAVHSEIQKYLTTQGIEEADIKRVKNFLARFGNDYDESLARFGETGNVELTLMDKMRVAVINYLDKHGYRKSGSKAPTMAECVSFLADIYAKNAQTQGTATAATVGIDVMRNPTPVAQPTTVGEGSSVTSVEQPQPTASVMSPEDINTAFDNQCKELNSTINGMLDSLTSPTTPESAKPELVSRMQTAIQSASFLTDRQKNYLMSLVSNPSNPNVKNSVDGAFNAFVLSEPPAEFVRQMQQRANATASVEETPQPVVSSTPVQTVRPAPAPVAEPAPTPTPTPTPTSTPTNVSSDVPVNTPEVKNDTSDKSRQYFDIDSFANVDEAIVFAEKRIGTLEQYINEIEHVEDKDLSKQIQKMLNDKETLNNESKALINNAFFRWENLNVISSSELKENIKSLIENDVSFVKQMLNNFLVIKNYQEEEDSSSTNNTSPKQPSKADDSKILETSKSSTNKVEAGDNSTQATASADEPVDTSEGVTENKPEGSTEKEPKGKTENTPEGKTENKTPSKTSVSGTEETEVAPRSEEKKARNDKNSTKKNNTPKNSGKEKPSTEKSKAEKQRTAMEASSSEDSNVRLSAASNLDATYKTLYELTEDEDDVVSAQAWETIRTKRINDSKSKAKTNLSMQLVEKVIEGPEDGKIALAGYPEKNIEGFSVYYLVQILATDSSPAVRMAVANNNSLPNYVLENIAKYDSDQDVRKAAQNSLDTQSKEQSKNTDKNKDKPSNRTSKDKESNSKSTSPKTNKGKNNTKPPEESKEKEPLSNPEEGKGDVPTEEEKSSEQRESDIDVEKLSLDELYELDKSTLLKYVKTYKNPEIACALALQYFDKGKIKEGRRWLNQSIKNNSGAANYVLGLAYIKGEYGYEQNVNKAIKYFEAAEAKNYPEAIGALGLLYLYGEGVEKNYRTAKTKFNKAAYRGDALSNLFLSEMFRKGLGVKVDLDKANALLEKAEKLQPGISEETVIPEIERTETDESEIDSSTETEETSSDAEETPDTSSEEQQEENTDNESTTENVISESDIDYVDDELDDLDDNENNTEGADAEPVGTLPKQHYIRNRRLQKVLNSIMSVWKIVFDDEIREDGTRIHMFKAEGNKHFNQRRSYLNKLLEINENEDKLTKQKERLFDYLVNINKWKNWLSKARIVSDKKIEKNREKHVKYWDRIASLKTKYNIPKEEQLEAAIDIELTNWENALNEATTWLDSPEFKKTLISSDVQRIEAAQEEIRNCLEDIKTIRQIYKKKPNLKAMFVDMAQGRARWGRALLNDFVEIKQDITSLLAKQPLVLKDLAMGENSEFSLHEQQKAGEDLERNQRDIDEATNIFKSIKDISENNFQAILYTALDKTPHSLRNRSFAIYVEAWQRFKKNNGEGPLTAEQMKQYNEILEKVNSQNNYTDYAVDQETSDFFNKHGPDTLVKYLTYLKNKYKNASKEHSRLSFSALLKILGQEKSARAYLDAETELQKTLPEKVKIRDDNEFNKFVEVSEKNAATVQENKAKAKAEAEKFSSKSIYNMMDRTEFESQPYWRVISGLSRDTLAGLKKTSLWGNLHKKLDTVYDEMRNQNERARIKLRLYKSIVSKAREEMASNFANIVKPSQRAGLSTAFEQIISVLDNEILDIESNLNSQENTDTLKERYSSTYLGMTNWGELLKTFDNIFVDVDAFDFMGNVRTENKKKQDARLSADKKFFDKLNEILSKKTYSKEAFAKAFTAWADELGVSITDKNSNNDIINILFKNPTWIKELNELKNGKGHSINVGDTIVSAQIMKEILRFDIIKNTALNKLSNFIGERYSKTATQKDITKILNVAKEQNAILLKEHQLVYLNKIYKEAKKEFVQIKSDKSDTEFKKFYENNINELKSKISALELEVKGKRPSPPTDLGVETKNKSRARVDKEISSVLNEKTIQLKSIEDNISFTKEEIRNIKTQIDFQKRRISETKEGKTKSKAKVKFEKTDKAIDTNFVLSGFFFRWLINTVPVERIAGFKGLNEKELKTFNDLFDGSDIYKSDKKTTDVPVIEQMIQDLFTSERTIFGEDFESASGLGKYLYDAPDIHGMYDMKSMNTSMLPLQMKKKFIKAMQEALENSDVQKLINDIVMAYEWTFNTKYDISEEMDDVDETTSEAFDEIKTLLKNANDRIVKQDNKYIEQSLNEATKGRKKSANVLKLIESQEDKLSDLESTHQKLEEDLQKYEEERKGLKSSIIIAESYINENKISDEIIRQSFKKDSNLPQSIKASIDILTKSVRFRDVASAVAVDHAIDNSTPITIGGGRRPEESSSGTVVPEDRIASLLKIDLSVAMNAFDIQRTENDKGSYEKYAAAAREAYAEDSEVGIKLIESILATPKDVTVTAEQEFILGIEKARADVFARNAAIKLNDSTLTPEQKEIAEKEFKEAREHIEMVVTATDKATTAVGRSLQALQWGLTKDAMSVSALVKEFERRTNRKIDEETYKAIVELATKWATTKGNLEDLINSLVTEWTKDSFNKPFNDFVSDIASRRNKDKNLSSNARNNVSNIIERAKRHLKEDPMAPLATVINFRRLINSIATYVVSQDVSRPRMAQLDSILAETNKYLSAFGIRLNMEEMEKLWSEYGPIKEQKISDVDARVLELRGIALLDSKLYDVQTNNVPPYKKQIGRVLSPEERERYGLLNDIMIEKNLYSPEDEKDIRVKTPLDRVKSRLLNQIEALSIAIESGVPLRRENAKHVSYDLEAETMKARYEYLKSIYDTLFAPDPSILWEKRVALTEARKQKYLDKLRERIETFKELGVIEKRAKPEEIHTANIDALNAEIKLAQEEFNELTEEYRKKASLLDRYQKQIDALNKELETGVFIKKHKKDFESIKNDPQVQALRKEAKALLIERERQMYQRERETWSVYRRLLEGARDVKDLMKSFRGSLDISSICVQGGLLALSNPKAAKEAVNKAIVAMSNSEKGKAIIQKMLDSDNAKIYQEAGLHIAEYSTETSIYARQEEGVNRNIRLQNLVERFHNKALDNVTKLGDRLIDSSERAFVTPLNVLRIAAFDSICEQAGGVDKLTKTDLQFIASVVNAASGHGDFFGQRGLIAALSKILWSPSRMAGQIETVLLPARLLIKRKELSPGVAGAITAQLIARPALSFAIISGLLALLNSMSDDEEDDDELVYNKDGTIEWDPRSSKFLRPRLGSRYLTVTGGIEQYLVLAAKIFSGEKKDKYGNIISLSGEGSSNGNQVSDEIIQTMLLNKLSPEISTMMGLMNRKEPFGDKLDTWGKMGWFAIKNTSVPLLLENLYEIYQEEGVDDALIYGALEYIGITSNDYGQSSYSWAESDYRRACKAFDNAKTKEEQAEILEQCQFLRQRKDLANIRRAIEKLQEKADAMPPEDREPTVERIKYLQRLFINGLQ